MKNILIIFILLCLTSCTAQPQNSSDKNLETLETPSDTPEETPASSGSTAKSPSSTNEEEILPETSTQDPVLFGFWGLNGFISEEGLLDVANRFNATVFQVSSAAPHYTATSLLPLVKESGMKVTLNLSGSHSNFTTDGNFDLEKWKAKILEWQTACQNTEEDCIQDFIDQKILVGHMLLDDIFTFAGLPPTGDELDEMAAYSQSIFPNLFTFVRNKASTMPIPTLGYYQHLDAAVNQYTNYPAYSDGNITDYVNEQKLALASLNLLPINGLNLCDGGDGSSGQTGWTSGKFAMSKDEILNYGAALLNKEDFPDLVFFLMWEYDAEELWSDGVTIGANYLNQPEIQEALFYLGESTAI